MARRFKPVVVWRGLVLILLVSLAAAAAYLFPLPDARQFKNKNPSTTAYMELRRAQAAARGKKIKLDYRWVAYESISPHLISAVLVAEDEAYYRHHGVDWGQLRQAAAKNIKRRKFAFGGSTITQQTARNLYLSPAKNPLRKLKEILIARKMEKELGKRRILEIYLNIAEWGRGLFGAEAAARTYFGKPASALNPEEAAALAAVLPSPRRWNPAAPGRYVNMRSETILDRMRRSGYLMDDGENAEYSAEPEIQEPTAQAAPQLSLSSAPYVN